MWHFLELDIGYHNSKFQISWFPGSNFMGDSVRPSKTRLWRHCDVISYHCVSKLAHFVELGIGYRPQKFQCSRMSGSNFMEGVIKTPQCYNEIKSPVLIGLKWISHYFCVQLKSSFKNVLSSWWSLVNQLIISFSLSCRSFAQLWIWNCHYGLRV